MNSWSKVLGKAWKTELQWEVKVARSDLNPEKKNGIWNKVLVCCEWAFKFTSGLLNAPMWVERKECVCVRKRRNKKTLKLKRWIVGLLGPKLKISKLCHCALTESYKALQLLYNLYIEGRTHLGGLLSFIYSLFSIN